MNAWPPLSQGFVLLLSWKCQFIKYAFARPARPYFQTSSNMVRTVAVVSTRQGQLSCLLWLNTHFSLGCLRTQFRLDIGLHLIRSSYSGTVFHCVLTSNFTYLCSHSADCPLNMLCACSQVPSFYWRHPMLTVKAWAVEIPSTNTN